LTVPPGGPLARLRSASLGLRLAVVSMLATALVVGVTFVWLQARVADGVRRVFAAELAASQRGVRQLQDRELRLLLATSALVSTSPTLRAALQTRRVEANEGLAPRADLVATIQREVERVYGDLDRDLLAVTDERGRVLAAAGPGARLRPGDDLASFPAVRYALNTDSATADSGFGVLRRGGPPLQVGCVAILLDGYPIGALLLGERLERLLPPGEAGAATHAVAAADVVLASDLDAAPAGAAWTPPASGNGGPARVRLGGSDYVAVTLPIGATEDGRPATLTLLRSESAAQAPIARTLRVNFLLAGLIALALVAASALALARATLRPLSRFVSFLRAGADAGTPARFPGAGSAEELRTLTDAFNGLIESLQRQHDQLEQRTRELGRTNATLEEQIRERERAERALHASEEALRQSQRLESLGTLAGGVAHDFNNLLSVILGYAQMSASAAAPGSREADDLAQITQAAERASGLVRQLLAFSRRQVLQPQVLDLNRVVNGMQSMLKRLIGEHIFLKTRLDPALARIKADPGQLEQVIMNLVVNARDAMPDGGTVIIETANVTYDATDDGTEGMAAGPAVMLTVHDTGVGMDEATRMRVFEPFFTTKAPGQGTGLGLATVYGIVRQSGGTIAVESAPGQGCTFRIRFPRTAEETAGAGAAAPEPPPRGSETVLVVEDEGQLRALVRRALADLGYAVLEAANGLEALEIAAEHRGPIHLLLTDVVMPHLSGRELAQRLAASRPDTHVLFISGYTDEAIARHGVLAPGTVFLQKPVTPDRLARAVRAILDGAAAPRGTA